MEQPDTLEQLFAAAHSAMGGAAALGNIASVVASAQCMSPRGGYITELHSMRGDRLMFTQLWPEHAPLVAFVNGRYAWVRDQATGAVEPLEPISASIVRTHEFQLLPIVMRSRYHDLRLAGQEEFAGLPCHVVAMTDELGHPCWAYFSRDTHLWAGMALTDPRQPEQQGVRVVVEGWAAVEQVRLPSKVVASDAAGHFVLDFHTIRLNAVSPSIFMVPPEIVAAYSQVDSQATRMGMREMLDVPERKRNA